MRAAATTTAAPRDHACAAAAIMEQRGTTSSAAVRRAGCIALGAWSDLMDAAVGLSLPMQTTCLFHHPGERLDPALHLSNNVIRYEADFTGHIRSGNLVRVKRVVPPTARRWGSLCSLPLCFLVAQRISPRQLVDISLLPLRLALVTLLFVANSQDYLYRLDH